MDFFLGVQLHFTIDHLFLSSFLILLDFFPKCNTFSHFFLLYLYDLDSIQTPFYLIYVLPTTIFCRPIKNFLFFSACRPFSHEYENSVIKKPTSI